MIVFKYSSSLLLLISGILVLVFDVKIYANADMKKEKKGALLIGWLNISLACAAFVAYYVYEKWFWK